MLTFNAGISPFSVVGDGPDNFGNFWSDSNLDSDINFEWFDISEVGSLYSFPHNDEAGEPIDIGFDFPFLSSSYEQCIINANGWIGFGSDSDAWENTNIPSSAAPSPAIFALWDDLNPVNEQCNSYCSGNVYYYGDGEKFVVWFDQVAHWWTNFENSFYTFQVILYPSGDIVFNYLNLEGDYSSATIGMQNQNASDAMVMGVNNTNALLDNNFSISIKQVPDWVNVLNGNGNLSQGEGANIQITLDAENLNVGTYNSFLFVNTNVEDVTIPMALYVNEDNQLLGDINGDGAVNVQDIVIVVNYILQGLYSDIADMNEDGTLNVQDAIILIGIIIN